MYIKFACILCVCVLCAVLTIGIIVCYVTMWGRCRLPYRELLGNFQVRRENSKGSCLLHSCSEAVLTCLAVYERRQCGARGILSMLPCPSHFNKELKMVGLSVKKLAHPCASIMAIRAFPQALLCLVGLVGTFTAIWNHLSVLTRIKALWIGD